MTEHLRFDPDYEFEAGFDPALAWENENGFQGMAELCHGCGGCRDKQSTTGGVMCPTYRAANEEIFSTRGRANALRQAMSGDLGAATAANSERAERPVKGGGTEAFDVEFMREVMDLCIGCKGCANDCPSEVDMAKMKAKSPTSITSTTVRACGTVSLRTSIRSRRSEVGSRRCRTGGRNSPARGPHSNK